jgi:hypothetical protein
MVGLLALVNNSIESSVVLSPEVATEDIGDYGGSEAFIIWNKDNQLGNDIPKKGSDILHGGFQNIGFLML